MSWHCTYSVCLSGTCDALGSSDWLHEISSHSYHTKLLGIAVNVGAMEDLGECMYGTFVC